MGCPLRVQVGALYGSRAWQWPLQQAPLVVGLLLPVRALARRASEGSGLDYIPGTLAKGLAGAHFGEKDQMKLKNGTVG